MSVVRHLSELGLAVLLAATPAAADTVITADEVISCWDVRPAAGDSICFTLPRLELRTLSTLDVHEVRLTDSGRVAALSNRLPQLRVVLDSGQPIPAPAARALPMKVTRDSVWCASPPDTVAQSASPIRAATRFVSAELLSFGACLSTAEEGGGDACGTLHSVRLLHVGYEYDRVRLGLALFDINGVFVGSLLPVTAGYTIYERPVRYAGSLCAKVPEFYVEASGSFSNLDYIGSVAHSAIPFKGTLELVGSFDGYSIGGSLAVGLCRVVADRHWGAEPLSLYAAARLHLLRLRLGF